MSMTLVLAAGSTPQPGNILEIAGAVGSGDALAHGQQLATALQQMSMVWAVVFLIAGLACMFTGYKYYKVITILLATLIGAVGGYLLGKHIGAAYIVAGCFALLLGVCCFSLMKYAVAVIGGLAGAFIGANLWSSCAHLMFDKSQAAQFAQNYWVGALVGLIVLGMLAFILFKLSVMAFTSMSGSTIAVMGGLALLLQVPDWSEGVKSSISAHPIVIPLMVLVPTIIGMLLQQTTPALQGAGPKKDAGGAGGPPKKPATSPA